MNRRDLLRGLLTLPLAPLAAKLLPKGIPIRRDEHFECSEVFVVAEPQGTDQTSIWQIGWNDTPTFLVDAPWDPASVKLGKRNWLKEKINGY